MIPVIYYAHSMLFYNTPREVEELQILQRYFYNGLIYNPNCERIQYSQDPMLECIKVVKDPTITDIAFSAIHDLVGQGVYQEIQLALKKYKPVHIIKGKTCYPFSGAFELMKQDKRRAWARVI
jgi:hypothetical protein